MFESRKGRSVGRVGKACIDGLEVTVDGHCGVWLGSLCRLEERKTALLGRRCCLEKGSSSGLRPELFHRRHQRRRCDLVLEACWDSWEEEVCRSFYNRI